MQKYIRLFNTVKYLKPIQIYYRLYYLVRAKVRSVRGFSYPLSLASNATILTPFTSVLSYDVLVEKTFTFLNLSQPFKKSIDWNFSAYGKLWTYNLTYFDYLHQEQSSKEKGLVLIDDFIVQLESHKDALEPFPISLRGMNWIKFLTEHKVREQKIDDSLYAQYQILLDNLEYHLLGNHLLENSFALLFGAYYFQDETLYAKAKKILTHELEEQILNDGAHFELSPMYHQIMLFRVLDCVNLVQNNTFKHQELLKLLKRKASLMLGWLENMTYKNGDIPLLNDSANNIAPTSKALFTYATRLDIDVAKVALKESAYRKVLNDRYECVVDIGHIGPDYIPGHAHADTFNFELYLDAKPFIVDTGLSTYETNDRRTEERSTASHNSVEVMHTSSSTVWGGFRVAERARVIELKEYNNQIVATHDGYSKKFGIMHTRAWIFEENKIIIKDSLNKSTKAVSRLHFHPDVTEEMITEHIQIKNYKSKIINYKYAPEFNKLVNAKVLEIEFEKDLEVEISIKV